MQRARDGRKKQTLALTFPEADDGDRETAPSGEQSHIARRRLPSSAPSHELDGEIDLVIAESTSFAIARPAEASVSSAPPFALDADRAPASTRRSVSPGHSPARRGRGLALALVVLASAGLGAAVMAAVHQGHDRVEPRAVRMEGATEGPAPTAATPPRATATGAGDVPSVDVGSLPRAPVGTVIGNPEHRLWIDGVLAPSWQALVKCGPHTVQVGSSGTPRDVDVPCGEGVSVLP